MIFHKPVLLQEALFYLSPKDGETYIDATYGAGGYTRAILEKANCKVIAFDRDENVLPIAEQFKSEFQDRFEFINTVFSKIDELGKAKVDGIVADFGVSSMQLDVSERGFSFQNEGRLNMRMGYNQFSAFHVVNNFPETKLSEIIEKFGEERLHKKIANFIVAGRAKKPIETTTELAKIIESAYGKEAKYSKIHPATKTFQAIRIFINDELSEIESLLTKSIDLLKSGGKLVTVSFHSLEDSIVKEFLRKNSSKKKKINKYKTDLLDEEVILPPFEILTKNVIVPTAFEVRENIRSRSAKLRAAKKSGIYTKTDFSSNVFSNF